MFSAAQRRSSETQSLLQSTHFIRLLSPEDFGHGSECLRLLVWERADRNLIFQRRNFFKISNPISKSSVGTYENRFGTWNHALEAFIGWVNQGQNDPGEKNEENITKTQNKPQKRSTKRDISERLRFSILLRDGFRCLSCGRSPLKSPGIELHVDHVIPWSEGGETVLKNLQTKCSVCNLGKGNAFRE
jgi:hypothetical protein